MDKVVIANRSAMAGKYGQGALALIDAALARLVFADAARGLSTKVVEIDDAKQMHSFRLGPVCGPTDQRTAKDAVDAIYRSQKPAYLMLLDGPDVVPHIVLDRIAGITDADDTIDSDLPYACDAPFGSAIDGFLAVTRVVGRLPMPRRANDVGKLVELLDRCATFKPRPLQSFTAPFAISALPWQTSTRLSLNSLFGTTAALHVSPTAGHSAIDAMLGADVHFINCHGARFDPRFYGQDGGSFPIAMESRLVAPHVAAGTVVAAECCYGAELYDPSVADDVEPICMAYLNAGATAFVGSTTIAYGPADTNGQADLLTQYFIKEAVKGGSTGAAMLSARQRFVSTQVMASPANLKTLAQFVLYGDPSLQAIEDPAATLVAAAATGGVPAAKSLVETIDPTGRRDASRIAFVNNGKAVASAATFLGAPVREEAVTLERLRAIASAHGFDDEPLVMTVKGGATYRAGIKAMGATGRRVAVTTMREEKRPERPFDVYRILTAQMLDSKIYSIEVSVSR